MGYNEVQTCGSISSTSVPTQMYVAHGAGSTIKSSKFVNHGLLLWNQGRRKWIGNKKAVSRAQRFRMLKLRTLCLCISKKFSICCGSSTNDSLLRTKKPFPRPIPLGKMVDFLVDIWEEEGMYG